jgi:hypothetical protein
MRKVGWVLVGLILFASAANGVRMLLRNKEDKDAAELAYRTVQSVLTRGKPMTEVRGLERQFEVLLRNPYGHPHLKTLAADFPSMAFHEGRNAVFYFGLEPTNPDGTVDSTFSSYASVHKGPDRGTYSSGGRFPPEMLFHRVAVEGDIVVVEFEISKNAKKPVEDDGFSFEPGATYVTRMDIAALLNPNEPATKVYTEFFPKAKRK